MLLEKYDEYLEDMGETLDDMEDSIDDADGSKIRIKMVTKTSSSDLMALSVEIREDGNKEEVIDVQIGAKGIKKSDKITVAVRGQQMLEFAVKQNDRDGYRAELTVSQSESESVSVFVKINKEGSKFSVGLENKVTYSEETTTEKYSVEGKYEKSGKKHTFEFKDIVYTDASGAEQSLIKDFMDAAEEENIEFEVKLIICENEKPKPLSKGKVKSVFTLTEEDFDEFKLAAEELVSEFKNAFGGAESDITVDPVID